MIPNFVTLSQQLSYQGQRRLIVLTGSRQWQLFHLSNLTKICPGDWLTISDQALTLFESNQKDDFKVKRISNDNSNDENDETVKKIADVETKHYTFQKAKQLLGCEYLHAVIDANDGFHCEAFAIVAGTLRAGSWLVLLLPPYAQWLEHNDNDSLRWNEQQRTIKTPNFYSHLQQNLNDPSVIVLDEANIMTTQLTFLPTQEQWSLPNSGPTVSQKQILEILQQAKKGIWGLLAERGRGKSALAGMFLAQAKGQNWLCAPAKANTTVLRQYLESNSTDQMIVDTNNDNINKKDLVVENHHNKDVNAVQFWSPDNLLKHCQQYFIPNHMDSDTNWLVIDEAAAIPLPMLKQIISYFPRVLLTTTIQGYEGTGRGFLLKFCHQLNDFNELSLNEPIRWAKNDPLEHWLNSFLLMQDGQEIKANDQHIVIDTIKQSQWCQYPEKLAAFYGLLTAAHYRTSPLDLRRLLDAQGQHFEAAYQPELRSSSHFIDLAKQCNSDHTKGNIVGGLWLIDEGGLEPSLTWSIWAGKRRPAGNLVAQSLAAHGYFPIAGQLRSRRVSRIAVQASFRRHGIARRLIERSHITAIKQQLDYLSVSFGYNKELAAFWQACGFMIVRIGSHCEASSGLFTAMAMLPISAAGHSLVKSAHYAFRRDVHYHPSYTQLAIDEWQDNDNKQNQLNDDDWLMLAGFAFAHKPIECVQPAIIRLMDDIKDIAISNASDGCNKNIVVWWYQQWKSYYHQQNQKVSEQPEYKMLENDIQQRCIEHFSLQGKKMLINRLREDVCHYLNMLRPDWTQHWQEKISQF